MLIHAITAEPRPQHSDSCSPNLYNERDVDRLLGHLPRQVLRGVPHTTNGLQPNVPLMIVENIPRLVATSSTPVSFYLAGKNGVGVTSASC